MNPPVIIYRISHWFYLKRMVRIAKFLSFVNRFFFSVWIPGSATIGRNFTLGYWGLGVVIHSNTKIGDNVTIAQNVTIGRNFGDQNVPIISDDVYIGAGSVIFGEIVIGENTIIGSNSVINKNIGPNCTVAGNPFKVLKEGRLAKYYELDKVKK